MKLHGLEIPLNKKDGKNQEADEVTATGSCLCGAVRYTVWCPLDEEIRPCHCSQCRKQSGHYASYVQVETWDAVEIEGADSVTWYAASEDARRGFCKTCGSQLFWVPDPEKTGRTLDSHTQPIKVGAHIFVADKGDYYDISDPVPQHDAYPEQSD